MYQPLQIFIVAPRPNPRYPEAVEAPPEVVVNPEIIERSAEMVLEWEGRLSIPGLRGAVPRHGSFVARYQNVEGDEVTREFHDFAARIFQREDDHPRGIVFLDRLESMASLATGRECQRRFARG